MSERFSTRMLKQVFCLLFVFTFMGTCTAFNLQAETLEEVLKAQEVSKLQAVISYIEKNPTAEDVESAYSVAFSMGTQLKMTEKVVPLAEKYLEGDGTNAQAKATRLIVDDLAAKGKVEEATELFQTLIRFRARRDPNTAGICGLRLAETVQIAGRADLARKIYLLMIEVLPLHPSIERSCQSTLKKLELVQKAAPEVTVNDFEDNPIKLEDYKGKVVLVDFWGTFCGPCIAEFPEMKKIYAEYKDQGFEIIGIAADESKAEVLAFQEQYKLPWKLAMADSDDMATYDRYMVQMLPSTYIIDRKGNMTAVDLRGDSMYEAIHAQFKKEK